MAFEAYSFAEYLPDKGMDVCAENFNEFFRTMLERQSIWYKRFIDKKPFPWTDDEILMNYKFTNVYRDLDKNSQWQIKNILLDDSLDEMNLIWKLLVFRYFNNPLTFEYAEKKYGWKQGIPNYEEYDKDKFAEMISEFRSTGVNPYTSAYLINTKIAKGESRDWCYTELVIPNLHKKIPQIIHLAKTANEPEELIDFINSFPSTSSFISHEFYQDFTYIQKYTDRKFTRFTQNDFTNVGPGAGVGIRLIFPSLNVRAQKQAIYWLRDLANESLMNIGNFPYLHWDKKKRDYYVNNECNITLHQIEMWLCEYQKYWKMKIGTGKQRSKYQPPK